MKILELYANPLNLRGQIKYTEQGCPVMPCDFLSGLQANVALSELHLFRPVNEASQKIMVLQWWWDERGNLYMARKF